MRTIKLCFLTSIICFVFLAGCEKNHILTELQVIQFPDPQLTNLTASGLKDLRLTDPSNIIGYAASLNFQTSDFFKTYAAYNQGIAMGSIIRLAPDSVTFCTVSTDNIFTVYDQRLSGNGVIGDRFSISRQEMGDSGNGYWYNLLTFGKPFFLTGSKGWIGCDVLRTFNSATNPDPEGVRIYKVTGSNYQKVGHIEGTGMNLTGIRFVDDLVGYVSITAYPNSLIYKTSDGGTSWQLIFSAPFQYGIHLSYADESVVVFWSQQMIVQLSSSGEVLASTSFDHNALVDSYLTEDGVLFVVQDAAADIEVYSTLFRSEDKGKTWQHIPTKFYGTHVSFLDIHHGLAWGDRILQYTDNGGSSWKLLLFPISQGD